MKFYQNSRFWVLTSVTLVALGMVYLFFEWEVERVEVPKGYFMVLIHRWGKDLPEKEIVAPDDSYKGVMLDEKMPGRYFLNPLFWAHEIYPMVEVPKDKCLVLTRKFGKEIPPERIASGDLLAGPDERGIVRDVLKPGSHRINKYAYDYRIESAVEVAVDQVGVRNLKVGKDPRRLPRDPKRSPYVVPEGYHGVQETPVPPGTYYVNPYMETITPVDVRSHRVELMDITFPSRDGFIIQPRVLVEYAVKPEKAPELLIRLTDKGMLHQTDQTPEEQAKNEILQKVILPHIRGYARIEGSNFDARDFIVTATAGSNTSGPRKLNTRERLQRALLDKIKPKCQELGIEMRAVTLAQLDPPPELAEQIRERDIAIVEQERNRTQLKQFKAAQELKYAEGLKQQNHERVDADTRMIQAKNKAQQLLEVEESRLKTELENAQLRLDAARQEASAVLSRGKAEATVIQLKNEAEVAGLRKAVQGFNTVHDFAQYEMLKRLGPALTEIFASDDSEFAKLFSTYMTPVPGTKVPAAQAQATPAGQPTPTTPH